MSPKVGYVPFVCFVVLYIFFDLVLPQPEFHKRREAKEKRKKKKKSDFFVSLLSSSFFSFTIYFFFLWSAIGLKKYTPRNIVEGGEKKRMKIFWALSGQNSAKMIVPTATANNMRHGDGKENVKKKKKKKITRRLSVP